MARLTARLGASLLLIAGMLCVAALIVARVWPSYQIAFVQRSTNPATLAFEDTLYLYDLRHSIQLPLLRNRNIGHLHWSDDGRFLAVNEQQTSTYLSFLTVIDLTTASTYTAGDDFIYGGLTWSPGQQTLAAHRADVDLNPLQIVAVDVPAQTISLLTDDALGAAHLSWSPDGRWISYRIEPYNQPPRLRLLDVESGDIQSLLPNPPPSLRYSGGQPAIWSPDSQRIILNRGPLELIDIQDLPLSTPIVDLETRNIQFLDLHYPAMYMQASNDGEQLAFSGVFQVYDPYSRATNTTVRRGRYDLATDEVTPLPDDCERPHWSPDDAWILCRTTFSLYRIHVDDDASDRQIIFDVPIAEAVWRP